MLLKCEPLSSNPQDPGRSASILGSRDPAQETPASWARFFGICSSKHGGGQGLEVLTSTCVHGWALPHRHTHAFSNTHLHMHMPSLSHTHILTYTHMYSHTHTCSHTHAVTHTCSHTHTCTHMHSHTHALTCTHKKFKKELPTGKYHQGARRLERWLCS